LEIQSGNGGLTVKVNLWSMKKKIKDFSAESARLWIKGQVTHGDTRKVEKFNDAGELIAILGRWNVGKYQQLKETKRA